MYVPERLSMIVKSICNWYGMWDLRNDLHDRARDNA